MTTTPATARTDVAPAPAPSGITTATVRRLGAVLATGATLYAAAFPLIGPQTGGLGGRIADLLGLGFQIGLFALLTVMLRTGATGTSRVARAMIRVEYALLGLAAVWSALHATVPTDVQDAPWLVALDVFWPLSMLGMLVIGIKVAVAGRWRGVLRAWPVVAESWAVVTIPAGAILGFGIGAWVGGVHMLLGYGLLGLLLALRPEQTGATG